MDDRHQHYSMHQQQQQQLHHQQQQQQNPQVYAAHSQILPSSHHHPQPHPLTVQPEIPAPQYHHGSSHSPQQWGESTRDQPQPRGQYMAEHLFSAVQQQLESMNRDHERDQNQPSQSGETVTHPRTEESNDPNTAQSTDQGHDSPKLTELTTPDHDTSPKLTELTTREKPTEAPPVASETSSSAVPVSLTPLQNAPRTNQESTGNESEGQKEAVVPAPQGDSDKDKEKDVVWQTLMIGGKKVRYKVLGNVKMRKATTVAPGKTLPSGQESCALLKPGALLKPTAGGTPGSTPKKPLKIVKLLPKGTILPPKGKPPTTGDKESAKKDTEKDNQEKPEENASVSDKAETNSEQQEEHSGNKETAETSSRNEDKDDDDDNEIVKININIAKDKKSPQKVKQKRKKGANDAVAKKIKKERLILPKEPMEIPKKRRSGRPRKPVSLVESILSDEDLSELDDETESPAEFYPSGSSKRNVKFTAKMAHWSYQEIRALVGFLISAKKANLYKKEWPTMKESESFWERAADCCNVVRLDKKKRSGFACAHWTQCYLKPKYITTSKMRLYYNSSEFNAPPNQYVTCKCYDPSLENTVEKKIKSKKSKHLPYQPFRDQGIQAGAMTTFKETQTVVSTVSVSNGLKDFVSMLSAKDALEVADLALHYALKSKTLYNVADNFLELCVGAFEVLQKYRQANVIEEFARVLSTSREDGLPRMQPDKMPFAMIAYNIRYFNNTSPFGLTVPPPYAEWLHCMYNTFGQRFHELFEGPIPDKMEIADRHPYRNVLLNVATVSKAYLKRQTDERDKAEAENPPEEFNNDAPQEVLRRKQLMNKQGKAIRELMTDIAIPPLARRKLQQAFSIIQRTSNLTTPENEPTCETCGAAIPKPPKPPKKYVRKKRDRKRLGTDIRHKSEGKKRRMDKSGNKLVPVNLSRVDHGDKDVVVTIHQAQDIQASIPMSSPRRKSGESSQRRVEATFPRNLYQAVPGAGPLERMLINAPGIPPARELPPSLQDKWIPTHMNPSQENWGVRPQQIPATAAAVAAAAAARHVYAPPNHGSAVNILWEPGQPSSGWQHEEVQNPIEPQQHPQQQQHPQRTPMVPSSTSGTGIHIGQAQVSHTYY